MSLANYTSEKKELLKQLLDSIVANEFRYFEKFLNKMKRIESETLIIWGDQDEVLLYYKHDARYRSKLNVNNFI